MSSTDKAQTSAGNVDPRLYEPSMEDILASIRRIIADDHVLPGRVHDGDGEANLRAALESAPVHAERSPGGFPPSQDKPTFLRGTVDSAPVYRHPASISTQPAPQPHAQPQAQGRITAPQFAMPDTPAPRPVEVQHSPASSPSLDVPITVPAAPGLEAGASAALLSDAASKAVTDALGRLTVSRTANRDAVIHEMVNDLLRPMLKAWLDDNLPPLVERLVRAEIERIHGGAAGRG